MSTSARRPSATTPASSQRPSAATFSSDASFIDATFSGEANFIDTTFSSKADLIDTTFSGEADFVDTTFSGEADFIDTTFSDATFSEATFSSDTYFDRAAFGGDTDFFDATFRRLASFEDATFEQSRKLGPLLAYRGLVLDGVQFKQPVQIEVSTIALCCRRARFPAGVQFRLRWAQVMLDDADLPAPSILTGIRRLASAKSAAREERMARNWQRLTVIDRLTKSAATGFDSPPRDSTLHRRARGRRRRAPQTLAGTSEQPQLLSLQRANVAGLGLSNVSLADCRFAGAHNLGKLRLEAGVPFAIAPTRLGWLSWDWRQVIAEERAWRALRSPHTGRPPVEPRDLLAGYSTGDTSTCATRPFSDQRHSCRPSAPEGVPSPK